MTLQLGIATFAGGFIFPFLITLCWGKMVDEFGPSGGWLAAGFIVGTTWTLNHGIGLIYQTGAWVDMAWAAGYGMFVKGIILGEGDAGKGFVNLIMAAIGGVLGGLILSFIL